MNHIAGSLDWEREEIKQAELMSGDIPVERKLYKEEKSFVPARNGELSQEIIRENIEENIRFVPE